jgi:DNA transposition AAA+ family ATPase
MAKPTTIPTETTTEELRGASIVARGESALASSAHSRINIPFNLNSWRDLHPEIAEELAWFHQHSLEENLDWKQVCNALNYSQTVIFRVLKGTYEGSWDKVVESIKSYRRIITERVAIKHADFRETRITRLVTGGLTYALANNSITKITGESRQGKTVAAKWWRDQNNHGRTAYITAPAIGGAKPLLKELAMVLGINKANSTTNMHDAILRAFNSNRMLIVDEAHRLLPKDRRTDPTLLEILRDIHDRTGCGLGLLTTRRFDEGIAKSDYMYEQVLGRIGMPVQLPREFEWDDIDPIVSQYMTSTPADLKKELIKIANSPGRLGIVCETLKFASRIASKKECKLTADVVKESIAVRHQMMGEIQYAKK